MLEQHTGGTRRKQSVVGDVTILHNIIFDEINVK